MELEQFGPFTNTFALICVLTALFSGVVFKAIGRLKRWTRITSGSLPFLIYAGARTITIALMVVAYITIEETNYCWFGGIAVLCGVIGIVFIYRFDHTVKLHVRDIPLVGSNGNPLTDRRNRPLVEKIIVGREKDVRQTALADFKEAQKKIPGLTLLQFMSGYGNPPNNPETLWEPDLLAGISSKLTAQLMIIVLFSAMALYLAALTLDIYLRTHGSTS